MRTLFTFGAVLVSVFIIGCGVPTTGTTVVDWDKTLAQYPDSAYWKAFGEATSRNMQMARDMATMKARADIAKKVGTTKTEGNATTTSAQLTFSRAVQFESMKDSESGAYRVKVLVVAPKAYNSAR